MTTEQVLKTLRNPGNELPRKELEEVVQRREEFVPLLIEEIERVTRLGDEADPDDDLATFALYLLAELREPRALQPIMEFFTLNEKTEKDFFGDLITESGSRILAAVGQDDPEALRAYAKRKDISRWVRSAAFHALVMQVQLGLQPRESVVRFFLELMKTNEFGEDPEAWTHLIDACMDLHPREFLEEIQRLYARDLVELEVVGYFEAVQEEADQDPEAHQLNQTSRKSLIIRAEDEVSWWPQFAKPESKKSNLKPTPPPPKAPEVIKPVAQSAPPRSNPFSNVGRNDLCPCGSGKKYKKCCLGRV